jgi:hypothetical protein
MKSITIDGEVGRKLEAATGHIEVRNQDGHVIGMFIPGIDLDDKQDLHSPCSIKELESRANEGGGRTTAEILRELEKLQ